MMQTKMLVLISALLAGAPALAQGSPAPGAQYYAPQGNAAPAPGAVSTVAPQYTGTSNQGSYAGASSPLPGSSSVYRPAGPGGAQGSMYQMLPISLDDAKLRIEELRNLVAVSRPQDVQDKVNAFCEWLVDMTEAHNRLCNSFSKQDSLKAQAQAERASAQKFSHLKNEATFLKAEILIKQSRIPEAVGPLVDIVVNEPKGSAGIAAYNRLKEIGFSEAVPDAVVPAVSATPAPVTTVVSSVKAQTVPKTIKTQAAKRPAPAVSAHAVFVH
jgi:hypothetical protein